MAGVLVGPMTRHYSRRAFVAGGLVALAGCGSGGGDGSSEGANGGGDDGGGTGGEDTETPETGNSNPAVGDVDQQGDLDLTSPAFDDGGAIPDRFGYDAENLNPPLSIAGVPPDAASLVLVMDDPDAVEPAGKVWLHWLVWNIPPDTSEIPEGWEPTDAVEGRNDFGERGYGGPAPPDGEHTYRFKLYAIGTTLELPDAASKPEVGTAMQGDVLARTQLEGTYAP